ncbi:MAG: hypothetical protein A4S09_02130 [Proteobacteria bacterium SG_bin7]|nr:MAG: hypothetical protein A4S09_02130 [Proteobacteria bacterium SG_bin7]
MSELRKPKPSEMCSPGYHVVHGHERVCHSGTVTWVDAHVRRNRGKIKPGLLVENILYLFWNSKKKYSPLNPVDDYPQGDEYDSLIQFWLDYWKPQGLKFPDDLDPLMIKALISVESSFNPKAKSKDPKSTASELMQVTDQSLRVLGGFPNKEKWIETRKHLIHVTKADKLDPVVSVALGTRLLAHKFSQVPKKYPKNARSTFVGYNQWNKKGEAYADEVLARYEKARKKK